MSMETAMSERRDLTPEQRAELRREHVAAGRPHDSYCDADGEPWPCPTIRALEQLDRLEGEVERLERLLAWSTRRAWCTSHEDTERLALSLGAPPFGKTTEEMGVRMEWYDILDLEISQIVERARQAGRRQ